MQSEYVERLFHAAGADYYSAKVCTALLTEQPYGEIFKLVPTYGSYNQERWHTVVNIHQMVVVWSPAVAHEWLVIAAKPFFTPVVGCAYAKGSFLGFLKAGIWLDKNCKGQTEFQEKLLWTLAGMVCSPTKLAIHEMNLATNGYDRALAEAIREYVFPSKETPDRAKQLESALTFIQQMGKDENFGPLDELFIERLCHGILSRRPSSQKIAATHFLLQNYSSLPTDCVNTELKYN